MITLLGHSKILLFAKWGVQQPPFVNKQINKDIRRNRQIKSNILKGLVNHLMFSAQGDLFGKAVATHFSIKLAIIAHETSPLVRMTQQISLGFSENYKPPRNHFKCLRIQI